MREIEILENADLVSTRAAEFFVDTAETALELSGKFSVALSGGSTPKALYQKLTNAELEWDRIKFYFGDERAVPPDHSESNFRMAYETLFKPLQISEDQIHRWRTELHDPEAIAYQYQKNLEELGATPRFDLMLLGIGDDCHTASLFPETDALLETTRYAVSNWVPKLQTHRFTLTYPVINNSERILVMATGLAKAEAVQHAFSKVHDPIRFPIQAVSPKDGRELWLLDKDAASKLET